MAIASFDPAGWGGAIVDPAGGLEALAAAGGSYRLMLGAVLEAILDRYESRGDYPFVDTKLSLLDGKDFDADDPVRGPGVIYGWIQARGLEALAGHADWLARWAELDEALRRRTLRRVRGMMAGVLENMEALRAANGGRLFFTMTPSGRPLRMAAGRLVPHQVPDGSPANVTELLYAKGMAAAAAALGEKRKLREACAWYRQIDRDISAGRLAGDQQPLDPANVAVREVPARRGNGGRMLGLGAAALFLECTGDPAYRQMGLAYLDYLLAFHAHTDPHPPIGRPFDAWEFIGEDEKPWLDERGALLSDPGHACETVGLALKFLAAGRKRRALAGVDDRRLAEYRRALPAMLERNFANGFAPTGCGIVKAFDLVSRKCLRTDMPWWSLPETMRAALGAAAVVAETDRPRFVEIAARCSNAFCGRFVRPDLHLMAYQSLSADGRPIDTIPATPDADPGYHTGLSIIDCLDLLAALTGPSPAPATGRWRAPPAGRSRWC